MKSKSCPDYLGWEKRIMLSRYIWKWLIRPNWPGKGGWWMREFWDAMLLIFILHPPTTAAACAHLEPPVCLCLLPSVAAGGEGTTSTYVYAGLELAESAARCLDSVLKLRVVWLYDVFGSSVQFQPDPRTLRSSGATLCLVCVWLCLADYQNGQRRSFFIPHSDTLNWLLGKY